MQINKRENSLQKIHLDDRLSEQKLSFEILHTESDRQAAKKVKETLINSGILQAQITSTKSSAEGRGLVILARVQEKDHTMILSEFGIKRFDPSEVAKRILKEVESYLDSGYFVDEHLADQLMIPMLFCGGHYRSGALSLHSRTNIKTIEAFLGKVFEVEGREVKCPGIAEL